MTRGEWRWLLLSYLAWRLGLLLLALAAPVLFVYDPSFPYAFERLPLYGVPQLVYSWANFDGLHYLTIAERGYVGTALIQAFFPVFPLLMRAVSVVTQNALVAGLVLSTLFSGALWVSWYYFLKLHFDRQVARIGMAVLFLFPTSFFFTAVYSESLFLLLILWAFICAQRKQWWLVAVLAMLISATRIVGIFVVPALMLEALQIERFQDVFKQGKAWLRKPTVSWLSVKPVALISLGSLGLLAYMAFLWQEFKDPLYFFHVQSEFGSGRQENLVLYPQVVWRYIKILLTYQPHDWKYFAYIQEAMVGVLGFGALLLSLKKVRLSWWLFAVLAFILPTLTGNFSSMPRYVLVCFPLFIWIALQLQSKRWFLWLYLLGSTLLLVINTMLFIQGYWVA